MERHGCQRLARTDWPRTDRGRLRLRLCGPSISRSLVAKIGFPEKKFFIWFDDIEYSLRILAEPGAEVLAVPEAEFYHEFGGSTKQVSFLGRKSNRPNQAAWKSYYNARNPLYILTRLHPRARDLAFYAKCQVRSLLGELIYEQDRWSRVGFRLRGVADGLMGRMGKRT